MKRAFDLFFALCAAAILLLPIGLIALVVRWTSPGPALYWSDRIGRDNRIFKMPKFRSMRLDTPAVATHLLSDPDRYLTPVGSFLRKTSLDELPQLWSILKGDMSLVGPRPALPYEVEKYQSWHLRRILEVRPGITGLWQVEGRSKTSFDDMVRLDLRYIRNCSLAFDLRILLKTVKVVLKRDGAT